MPLFDNYTPETIKTSILERIGTDLQTREGSYTYDLVAAMAFEVWRWCMTLDELIHAFYVDENSGPYLDDHAGLLGLARKLGTRAYAVIRFAGRDGTTIPSGTVFLTAEGLQYTLTNSVTIQDGEAVGYLQAAEVGDLYNAEAGEISSILRNISGLDSWANEAAQGGTDPESDAALFARIDTRRKSPATSGNEAHYREWALECDGVGAVKVTKLWAGPGTVRVLIAGYDRQPVDQTVVANADAHIQTQRPVGADVTVISASGLPVSVTATVVIADDTTMDEVQALYVSKLDTYLQELADEYFRDPTVHSYTLHINRVAALLMDVPGVVDYTDLQINGGTVNIVVDETAVPVIGEVQLN